MIPFSKPMFPDKMVTDQQEEDKCKVRNKIQPFMKTKFLLHKIIKWTWRTVIKQA